MAQGPATQPSPATLTFTYPPAFSEFAVPMKEWLASKEKHYSGLHASGLVFNTTDGITRTLLLRRAPHDSMPNRWEPAGGAIDPEDPSILYGCARELYEEAGLTPKAFVRVIPTTGEGVPFTNRSGTHVFYRFTFEIEVEDDSVVKLDPNEHTAWLWASEEEVQNEKKDDGRDMPITAKMAKHLLLEGFKAKREAGESR